MARLRASIIVVVHAGSERLDDAAASLAHLAGRDDTELIIVDNGSADRCSEQARRRFPGARTIRCERNLGFAGGVHAGAEAADGEVLLLLNDDAAAEEGWLEAHLEALDADPDAAATAGRLSSWDASRHDHLTGVMTFDAHAFQLDQGRPIAEVAPPDPGQPVPFACGGNMAIRRADWERAGGFDRDLFAYFEDVELGWRLWAMGRTVVAAPQAAARHRGAATSAALGSFRRGVLFERNALRTFFACADSEHRAALGPAVLATFLHRMATFATSDPSLAALTADPFGPVPEPEPRGRRWRRRLREQGPLGALRHLAMRAIGGPRAGMPRLEDGLLLMQLRAAHGFFEGIEGTRRRRVELEQLRSTKDRELIDRFPRLIVPTYAGDAEWFGSDAFNDLLPPGWALEHRRLEQVLDSSLLT